VDASDRGPMREETRPIVGPVLGIFGGALPLYWASRELWVVWRTSTKSKLVRLLVGSHTKVTTGVLTELRNGFAALTIVELLVVLSAVLLLLFPRRHVLLGISMLAMTAVGVGLFQALPFQVGTIELLDGLIVCPACGFLGGIAGLLFRSDTEFARSYGFD